MEQDILCIDDLPTLSPDLVEFDSRTAEIRLGPWKTDRENSVNNAQPRSICPSV